MVKAKKAIKETQSEADKARHGLAEDLPQPIRQRHLAQSQLPAYEWEYWSQTYDAITRVFPMFPLKVDSLKFVGWRKLMKASFHVVTNGTVPSCTISDLW